MHIVDVLAEGIAGECGNIGEILVLRGRGNANIAVFLRLFGGFACEIAGNDIVGFPLCEKVQGHRRELLRRAALHKEHRIVVGDIHELAQKGNRAVHHSLERFGAVAHLGNGHTRSLVVEKFSLYLFQYLFGEHGRTRRKIENSHSLSPFVPSDDIVNFLTIYIV